MQDVEKYGGFSSVSTAYFFLVEHEVKGKKIRTIETLPIMYADKVNRNSIELEHYCDQILKLRNFNVRVRKIGIQSLLKLNGYFVNITGKTGNRLILRNAVSLCLKQNWLNYVKKFDKYLENGYLDKTITSDCNIKLYDELYSKFTAGIFSIRPNGIADKMNSGKQKFSDLSNEKQVVILAEILKLTSLGTMTANLTEIGASANSGKMLMNKEISNNNEVILINRSITGLYETKVDLLTV